MTTLTNLFSSPLVETVLAVLGFALLAVAAVVAGLILLTAGVWAAKQLRKEWAQLRAEPLIGAVFDAFDGMANSIEDYQKHVDEPDDPLVQLMARLLRQEPAETVRAIDNALTVVRQFGMIWPEIKDALDLEQPPKPPETAPPQGHEGVTSQ